MSCVLGADSPRRGCDLHDAQIAKAVDHCDNDKIKTIKYLNKLKGKVYLEHARVQWA